MKVDIGGAPSDEPCAAVGSKNYEYEEIGRLECRAYKIAIERKFGPPPEGCRLAIAANPHDFGRYFSVVCHYNDTVEAQVEYAIKVENGLGTWEEVQMRAPVTYDDKGGIALTLRDPEAWDMLKHPDLFEYLRQSDARML